MTTDMKANPWIMEAITFHLPAIGIKELQPHEVTS
jgi:hypothetical protein